MSRASVLPVVDAAYRLDRADDEWMSGLLEAARAALGRGSGLVGVSYRADRRVELTSEIMSVGEVSDEMRDDFRRVALSRPPHEVAASWAAPEALALASTTFEPISATPFDQWEGFEWMRQRGYVDSLAVKAFDATRHGIMLCTALRERTSIAPKEELRWSRVMTHVLAGLRLRRALLEGDGDAVLDPDGRVLHATGAARARTARDALRIAAACIDESRTKRAARDPDAVLAAWRGLVTGRWSLVDRFDSDGRRFLVARKNEPEVTSPRRLSPRGRQVLAYAALGHSNKQIAYTLGLAPSTVSGHLRGALRQLGVRHPSAIPGLPHDRSEAGE